MRGIDEPIDRRRQLRRRAVLQSLSELPLADRLWAVRRELEALRGPVGRDDPHLLEVERRERALDAMAMAARHQRVRAGVAPKVREFKEIEKALALSATLHDVISAFGTYRMAADVYEGRKMPDTPVTRARRKQAAGRRRTHDDYIAPVSLWLDEDPPEMTTRVYDCWAKEHNRTLAPDERPAVLYATIRKQLGLSWTEILAAAGANMEAATRPAARTRLADEGPLVATGTLAVLRGTTERAAYLESREDGFPTRVATLGRASLYLREDVEAHVAGHPFPERVVNALDELICDGRELAARLGLSPDSVRAYISKGRFELLPRPAGRAGGRHWWWGAEVENFLRLRESARAQRRRVSRR